MVIENERPVAATLGYVPNAQDLSAYGSGVALNFWGGILAFGGAKSHQF